jgi:bifunctional non-homologous end joining protein LigD
VRRTAGASRRAAAPKSARRSASPRAAPAGRFPEIPSDRDDAEIAAGRKRVRLTNLRKIFWPKLGVTKGDLIRYYAAISPWLLPHVADRAMVMKRYPHGAGGEYFFMKRAPFPRPEWIRTCAIEHASGSVIDFPVVDGLASLLWVVNLGCIDLNPWYARCDDVSRPDWVHFDLDPVKGGSFAQVCETALVVGRALGALGMPRYAKTTGSRGIHVYVPIVRGPTQKEVWGFAKRFAQEIASRRSDLATAEYRIARRPARRVLVDYNQNAWGRTLASIYSVRPSPRACVSTPVTWEEIEKGIAIEDFRIDNVVARVRRKGDLWAPLLAKKGRFDLSEYL